MVCGLPVSARGLVGVRYAVTWGAVVSMVCGLPVSSMRLVEGVATLTRRTIVLYGRRQLILLSSAHDRVRRGWGGDCLMWVLYLDPFSGVLKE